MAKRGEILKKLDMSSLNVHQLAEIRNEVLRNLALRQFGEGAQPTPIGPYDKHLSHHTKNSIELIEVGGQLIEPIRVRPSDLVGVADAGDE